MNTGTVLKDNGNMDFFFFKKKKGFLINALVYSVNHLIKALHKCLALLCL